MAIFLPEFMPAATSNIKNLINKTVQCLRTDTTFLYQPQGAANPGTSFGPSPSAGVNLVRAVLPADACLLNLDIYSGTPSNPTGAAAGAILYVGAVIPFTSITSTTTTATVTTPVLHNLVTGDQIVVNGTGVTNFDQAAPVTITVLNTTQFTYTISSTAATSLTGAIGCVSYFMQPQSVAAATPVAPTVGASPYTYTAPALGTVVVSGGTVSAISITRPGTATVVTGQTAGAFPVSAGDQVVVTYSVVPTVFSFLPTTIGVSGQLSIVQARCMNTTPYSNGVSGGLSVGWQPAAYPKFTQRTDIQCFVMYKETGTASTTGGPFFATFTYVR